VNARVVCHFLSDWPTCSNTGRYTDFTGLHCAGGSGSTLVISGATTFVTLKHCQFLCCSTAILSGASAVLEGCQFEGSIDSLAMLASSHGTQVALSSCTFTSWDEAVVVDGGAALEMHGGCQVTRICWSGVTVRGAGSRLSMTDVELLDVGYGSEDSNGWLPDAVAASHGAQVQLQKCTVANKKACAELGTSKAPDSGGCGLAAWGQGTHAEAKDSEFQGCFHGVNVSGQASVQLDKCTVARNKDGNVIAQSGAVVGLMGCTVADSLGRNGLAANGKGTRVDAKETTFQGNCRSGVEAWEHASVQLDKCTAARNKNASVFASNGAVVGLTGCTVADSLEGNGLGARDKGTRVDAKETTFQENCLRFVEAWEHASVQLDKCTAARNKDANVFAYNGAVVGLTGCTVADSLEKSGLGAGGKGTRVDAKETTFQGNFICGVTAGKHASLQLDKCTVARNKNVNVLAYEGAVVGLTGCTVADSLEGSGLVANGKGTRVDAKETTFQGNCQDGVHAWKEAMVQLDSCSVTRNKRKDVYSSENGVLSRWAAAWWPG
jgi:hypothetical protein